MDRKGTNELISGEKPFIAIVSSLRVYFVVRLPDYFAEVDYQDARVRIPSLQTLEHMVSHHDECKGGGAVFDATVLSFTVHCCFPDPGHDKRLQHLGQYWVESNGA